MILSKYCDFLEGEDGFYYLFNCLSLKWFKIERDLGDRLVSQNTNISDIEQLHPEFFDALVNEKFIVNDDVDDVERCVDKITKEFNSPENLVITINPTLDCNLKCWYCYENRHAGSVMSDLTIDNTINYIKNIINVGQTKSLRLSFFGGEPLLYYKRVVSPIINSIYDACKCNGVQFYVTFTTNGILISKSLLADLKNISSRVNFQIAFDGARKYHNSVKFLGTNFSCFDHTIANAKAALDNGYNVIVRCNYNKETVLSGQCQTSVDRSVPSQPHMQDNLYMKKDMSETPCS